MLIPAGGTIREAKFLVAGACGMRVQNKTFKKTQPREEAFPKKSAAATNYEIDAPPAMTRAQSLF